MIITWITIYVVDLEASKSFYRDFLGLTPAREFSPSPAMTIAFFAADNGVEIELIHDTAANPAPAASVSIGLRMQRYDALLAEARAQSLLVGEPATFGPGVECFFVNDPNGVGIQIIRQA